MFKQGDIVLTIFPFTDLSGSKLRPALIVSTNSLNVSGDYVCLQITSKIFTDPFFTKIGNSMLVTPLKLESGIRLQKIFTLNHQLIKRKISSMRQKDFEKVVLDINLRVFGQ